MLKLIAIQNIKPGKKEIQIPRRYNNICKILQPDSTYFLYKGYSIAEGKITKRPKPVLEGHLYSDSTPNIDICAIVGRNGSGKSSIIELYLRLMNNFAYVCPPAINNGRLFNTQFVCDVFAVAYFDDTETDRCHIVKQYGAIIEYMIDGEVIFRHDYNKPLKVPGMPLDEFPSSDLARECLSSLCYTMVINYSAYSYNNEDYLPEWNTEFNNSAKDERTEAERMEDRCWIDSLFHKNDGYQLPIVLNPFRENGMVDYNNERELTQERLYGMSLLTESPLDLILDGLVVDSFVFDVDDDLNPVGKTTYASYKVLSELLILRAISKMSGSQTEHKADEVGKQIVGTWSKCFGIDLEACIVDEIFDDGIKRNSSVLQAVNYIVYKTLKIAHTYPNYQYYSNIGQNLQKIEKFVKELFQDNSHITLKIRRSIAFIIFRHYKNGEYSVKKFRKSLSRTLPNRKSKYAKARKKYPMERYEDLPEYEWLDNDFMPASSFKVNMYLKDTKTGGSLISFSAMSSGERQIINSLSTMAYHLSNIDSVWDRASDDSDEITYKNICVFFDEMDLYLHPEFQTRMIDVMLKIIQGLHLKHIKGIQVICATHSPFILSDVLRDNVLYLQKGSEYKLDKKIRTFAANIGDLLCNSFFMNDGLIGCFARDKVESLVDWLENEGDNAKWDVKPAEEFVDLVDDPFVRMQLKMMLKDYKKEKELADAEN